MSLVLSFFEFVGKPFYYFFLFFLVLANKIFQIRLPKLIIIICVLFSILVVIQKKLPNVNDLKTRKINVSTMIYDRNGNLLYQIYKDENRSIVKINEVPNSLKMAVLASEDAEFYDHSGVSLRGIIRAIKKNITENEQVGGSTITQQLVKNVYLSPQKTFSRKVKEAILALIVEYKYSKDEILEMYLNEIPFGGTSYGVAEASKTYFNKDLKNLTLAESALLAGLIKSPTKYSPFGGNPQIAIDRQKTILKLMKINKYISQEDEDKAIVEKIVFANKNNHIQAPHFVMYVRELLEEKYGNEMVASGGLSVITTLDINIQKTAELIVKNEISKIKRLNVDNGALITTDPKSGEILAFVGSKDYFDQKNGNFNVITALRQPGSSVKPINYAYALSSGKWTPASLLSDTPITFKATGVEDYTPKNYDGKFRGNISLRSALAESRNIPAVRVLNSYGVSEMVNFGTKLGITSWNDSKNYGLSLTLGGGETRLFDMAQVYSIFATGGEKINIDPFISITDYKENKLYERKIKKEKVLDPGVAFIITDILSDNNARTPSFGLYSQLVINKHPEVAVKTGTSNNLRDNFTIGYSQDFLTAVWVGNNDNTPMSRVASGVTGASTIWNKMMSYLLKDKPPLKWQEPDDVIKMPICGYTGTLSCSGCLTKMEWFLKKYVPKTKCNPEFVKSLKSPAPQGQIL